MALLDEKAAARYLGVSVGLLRKWRYEGQPPATVRLGRLVRYDKGVLDALIVARTQPPRKEVA